MTAEVGKAKDHPSAVGRNEGFAQSPAIHGACRRCPSSPSILDDQHHLGRCRRPPICVISTVAGKSRVKLMVDNLG